MSRKRERPDWDDGRTVADMSGLERPNLFLPRTPPGDREPEAPAPEEDRAAGERYSPQERRWAILGAVRAGLLIAGAYIVGLGLLIALLLLVWNR